MRLNLVSASLLVAAVGCVFFAVGGFMLFPVALDLWEHSSAESKA